MGEIIEVIYENGVFKPLKKINLPNNTRGKVIVEKISNIEYFEKIIEDFSNEIEIKGKGIGEKFYEMLDKLDKKAPKVNKAFKILEEIRNDSY